MSGGHFNYNQYYISYIAEQIKEENVLKSFDKFKKDSFWSDEKTIKNDYSEYVLTFNKLYEFKNMIANLLQNTESIIKIIDYVESGDSGINNLDDVYENMCEIKKICSEYEDKIGKEYFSKEGKIDE